MYRTGTIHYRELHNIFCGITKSFRQSCIADCNSSSYLIRFSLKHRNFIKYIVRSARRKKEILKHDIQDEKYLAKKPPSDVNLYLTYACNLQTIRYRYILSESWEHLWENTMLEILVQNLYPTEW